MKQKKVAAEGVGQKKGDKDRKRVAAAEIVGKANPEERRRKEKERRDSSSRGAGGRFLSERGDFL